MSPFEFASALLVIVSILGIINHRYIRLPRTIGLLAGSLMMSIILILIDRAVDSVDLRLWWRETVAINDLPHFFLDGALAFMLFAATLHVDLHALSAQKWVVLALTTVGVVVATVLYGIGIWFVFYGAIPLGWCLTLGALLAPTDPVAVGGLLREAGLPAGPLALVNGESLFNDGVAVVIFLLMVDIADGQHPTVAGIALDLLTEAGGGVLLALTSARFVGDSFSHEIAAGLVTTNNDVGGAIATELGQTTIENSTFTANNVNGGKDDMGGAILDGHSWRWIFVINIPIGMLVLFSSARHVPESKDPSATGRVDLPGGGVDADEHPGRQQVERDDQAGHEHEGAPVHHPVPDSDGGSLIGGKTDSDGTKANPCITRLGRPARTARTARTANGAVCPRGAHTAARAAWLEVDNASVC